MDILERIRNLFPSSVRKRNSVQLDNSDKDDNNHASAPKEPKYRRIQEDFFNERWGSPIGDELADNPKRRQTIQVSTPFAKPLTPHRPNIRVIPIRHENRSSPKDSTHNSAYFRTHNSPPLPSNYDYQPYFATEQRRKILESRPEKIINKCMAMSMSNKAFDPTIQVSDDDDDDNEDILWLDLKSQSNNGKQQQHGRIFLDAKSLRKDSVPKLAPSQQYASSSNSSSRREPPGLRTIRANMNTSDAPPRRVNSNQIPDLYPMKVLLQRRGGDSNGLGHNNGFGYPLRESSNNQRSSFGYTNGWTSGNRVNHHERQSRESQPFVFDEQKRYTTGDRFLPCLGVQGSRHNQRSNVDTYKVGGSTSSRMMPVGSSTFSELQHKKTDYESYHQLLVNNLMPQFAQAKKTMTSPMASTSNVTIDITGEEGAAKEVIELSEDEDSASRNSKSVPIVEPINSLRKTLKEKPMLQDNWLANLALKYQGKALSRNKEIQATKEDCSRNEKETDDRTSMLARKMSEFMICDLILDESEPEWSEDESEIDDILPTLTPNDHTRVNQAVQGRSLDEVLITKFNMDVLRRDIQTLVGTSWLNDAVINFYMNLLVERGETREGALKVYAMNTFFLPRLLGGGHNAVRRWTRKVDIFAVDVIPVPVHVGSVHWCMAIIHLRNKTIRYYDSMGQSNQSVLNALSSYLREESLDKKKCEFDMSGWTIENVSNCPLQSNGCDCGVFSCMFAEYITRNRRISFTQENMQYFRRKMILEILNGKLLM